MQPDQLITSAPHALAAEVARNALTADAVKPGAITKSMLAADVLADLNATVVLPEQNATIQTGSITRSMLAPGVLSDLNATIAPGSITAGQLAPALLADLNRSVVITRSMLPSSVLADLNRTIVITRDMLPGDVLADLNGTIPRSRLAADVLTDLNRTFTISPGTVTEGMLAAGTVTPNKLSTEVVAALKPVILQEPQSVIGVSGASATFVTEATGRNLSYQWLQQGYAIAGANGNVLTITDLNATLHDGNYSVTVTNAFGSTTSAVATLDVNGSVTQGLVGWWKFDESNGTVANDSSGNNRNGSLTGFDSNTTQWVQGKVGGALQFDGTDDYVNINGYKGILGSSPRTMVAWIKTTKVESSIMSWGNHNSAQKWSFPIKTDKLRVEAYNGSIVGTNEVTDDQWHHVGSVLPTGTNNINQILFYLDGVAEPHSEISNMVINTVASQDVRIGGLDFNSRYFQGLIDDIRIYDRALNATEVAALYTLGSGNAPTTTTTGGGATIVADSGPVTTEKLSDGAVTTAKLSETILKYLQPEITSVTQSQTDSTGQAVTLTASAEGKYLSYQWRRNGQDLAGETNATLVMSDANGTVVDGNYTVAVSNDFGVATGGLSQARVDTTMKTVPGAVYSINNSGGATGHEVALTSFAIDSHETTKGLWDNIRAWALQNGYDFTNPGIGHAPEHPVHSVNWYDCVKWANALSEHEGLTPCYYTDNNRTQVYRTGEVDLTNYMVKWTANGYRLPTEAEWEVAARGLLIGSKYAWGGTASTTKANYDQSLIGNTTPAGSYASTGYGLYDLGGNLREWVWDWKDDRTYAYDFNETFPDANGFYDTFLDELNSTAVYYDDANKYSTINQFVDIADTQFESNASQVRTYYGSDGVNWALKKTLNLALPPFVVEVRNQIRIPNNHNPVYGVESKMKYFYVDGSTVFSALATRNNISTWGSMTYPNPHPSRKVSKIEVWLRQTSGANEREGYERNTEIWGPNPGEVTRYLTLDLPQEYKENNSTHFRVQVEADRFGNDDIWFELIDETNATKTYANVDFDKLLPLEAPIFKPNKLRIYFQRDTAITAIKAVSWTTNDPKSWLPGTHRVVRDNDYAENLQILSKRNFSTPSTATGTIGFRLVRRP